MITRQQSASRRARRIGTHLLATLIRPARWSPILAALALGLVGLPASPTVQAASAGSAAAAKSSGSSGSSANAPAKSPYAERFATVCAACHGANGRSDQPGIPVLAGQHSFYAITQLFMFREGRRDDPGMTAIAKDLSDADMRGFSQYISTLPPVSAPPPAEPADAERMKRGAALAREFKCVFCHGDDFSGGKQVPRIADQHEDYLRMTLRGFREGKRPGYTMAMTEAVGQVSLEDLDTLAYYVARFRKN